MPTPDSIPKVFLCYARENNDEKNKLQGGVAWLDQLRQRLKPYVKDHHFTVFSDRDIVKSDDVDAEIQNQLKEASIVVVLVSDALLGSEYVRDHEMPIILARADRDELKVIPLILNQCEPDLIGFPYTDAEGNPKTKLLTKFQGFGSPDHALLDLDDPIQQGNLLDQVAKAVSEVARRISPRRTNTPPHDIRNPPEKDPKIPPGVRLAQVGGGMPPGRRPAILAAVAMAIAAIVWFFVWKALTGSTEVPPAMAAVSPVAVDELASWSLALTSKEVGGLPREVTYSLLAGPAGMTISSGGLVEWTPTEAQGPSTNAVTVKVADAGPPGLSSTNSFAVIVREVPTAPLLESPGPQRARAGSTLSLTLTARDSDLPPNLLKFSKESGPNGLTVREDGFLSWTVPDSMGSSTQPVIFSVTDDGVPPKTASTNFVVTVQPAEPKPFTNSLEMAFVPISVAGTNVWFCVWETRVRDYEAYAKEKDGVDRRWKDPEENGVKLTPGPNHPVVNVNWHDAQDFCDWLTEKERGEERLQAGQRYRLPTDLEWSWAVGLTNEVGATPKDRNGKVPGVYPWGTNFPPTENTGNFVDEAHRRIFPSKHPWTKTYRDKDVATSPVGSYPALRNGLYDLSGNVWEWCSDRYESQQKSRVSRGGSWTSDEQGTLLSSCRNYYDPEAREPMIGFRVVLGGDGIAR